MAVLPRSRACDRVFLSFPCTCLYRGLRELGRFEQCARGMFGAAGDVIRAPEALWSVFRRCFDVLSAICLVANARLSMSEEI